MFSQVNKMSAHNLAVVLVPTLFQSMSQDLLRLTREFIIHHTLLFLVNALSLENDASAAPHVKYLPPDVTADTSGSRGRADHCLLRKTRAATAGPETSTCAFSEDI